MKPFNETKTEVVKEMSIGDVIMHGDVLLHRIEKVPDNFEQMQKEKNDALAYGEATGHLHKLFRMTDMPQGGAAFDLRDFGDEKYLKVFEPVLLKHQEHTVIQVPPGSYRVGIQREYDPFTKKIRQVAD